ncbi:MAG: T9SS type A sorting domain-containing protein [Bacteroidales bacterium]|nr:T9SS type A sorting domain-containing protein [Bacteroidales bacterium]
MKKLFTKVLCSLVLLAAINPLFAQDNTLRRSNQAEPITSSNHTRGGNWFAYDDGDFIDAIGGPQTFSWGIMIPADKLSEGQTLTKVSFFDYAMQDGEINIYFGGTNAPEMLIHKQAFSTTGTKNIVEFDLTAPLPLFGENLWVTLYTNNGDSFPAAMSENSGDKNGRWITLDGTTWNDITAYNISGTWMIRAYIEGYESISELSSSVSVYPNPVKDQLFVETEMAVKEISVYDVFGRQMTTVYDQQTVNVSELSNGVYFVKVKSENNEVVKRFIKK